MNRRMPHWIAKVGGGRWTVTVCAPATFRGDLGRIHATREDSELFDLRLIPVHLDRWIHFFFYGQGLRPLLKEKWDLIHMWEEPYIAAGWQIAAMSDTKTPLVYYSCQNLAKTYPIPFRQMERFCFRRASGWLAMGESTLKTQTERGFTGKPCEVVSPGVDIDKFRPDPDARAAVLNRLGWDEQRIPIVGFVGRFVEEKGLRLLMSVLDGLKTRWRALFLGGGPLEPELRSWSVRYPNDVRVMTGVPHAEVPAYLDALDILCVPSQTTPQWREQFGRVIIEAGACGVPVIGSDSGEIPAVISDAGIVVGENDQRSWAEALETLLQNPQERRRLGDRARDLAVNRHSHSVIALRLLRFFEKILDSGGAPGGRPPG